MYIVSFLGLFLWCLRFGSTFSKGRFGSTFSKGRFGSTFSKGRFGSTFSKGRGRFIFYPFSQLISFLQPPWQRLWRPSKWHVQSPC